VVGCRTRRSAAAITSEIRMTDSIEGKTLPRLSLRATSIDKVDVPDDLLNSWTLLYFYPKDDTPGCTKQACGYRDDSQKFKELGVKVYGVSLDDIASHEAFTEKYSLNFPLLSDPDHQLADFFGVYGEREWKGKKFNGLSRDTFLIDPKGKVARAFRAVDPTTTTQETFEAVKTLVNAPQ
jgi:peroxiredoxin Q/BCP